MSLGDTIYALASGSVKGGVQVIRLSGSQADQTLSALTGKMLPDSHYARLRSLYDPETGELLDEALILRMVAPHSYTGEDSVEIHAHGGRAVRQALFKAFNHLGLRHADPGEFTRRAVMNQKFDLTKAEAIADLVDAETSLQRQQALSQMQGSLTDLYQKWRQELTHIMAHKEAEIDFPDEDIPEEITEATRSKIVVLRQEMQDHLEIASKGQRIREGVRVALIGAPNVGKSSLLNALARREAAIVSEVAGTTRDVIEVHLDLQGLPFILWDTAGMRDSHDIIEQEGVRRAEIKAREADICLYLSDQGDFNHIDLDLPGEVIYLHTKNDLRVSEMAVNLPALSISTKTQSGLSELEQSLCLLGEKLLSHDGTALMTRARHQTHIAQAVEYLSAALQAPLPELMAEDIRSALLCLGRILGFVDIEDVLDLVFRDFCLGK